MLNSSYSTSQGFMHNLLDIVSTKLNEARLGMKHWWFSGGSEIQMKCLARMVENSNTNTFGLQVLCHRSDKKLPESDNYQCVVGRATVAKPLKQGDIVVRLVSEFFEAITNAGEDPSLQQLEKNFKGMEFEKQFACKFKHRPQENEVFGKVLVERLLPDGSREDIFKFNLVKNETEESVALSSGNPWTLEPVKELADVLKITSDNNWTDFALELGFTKSEIAKKLRPCNDPFNQVLSMYMQRGGTPDEFVRAMYDVNRKIRLGEVSPDTEAAESKSRLGHFFRFGTSSSPTVNSGSERPSTPAEEMAIPSRKRSWSSSDEEVTSKRIRIEENEAAPSSPFVTSMYDQHGIPTPERTPPVNSREGEFFGGSGPYTIVHRQSTPTQPSAPCKNPVCTSLNVTPVSQVSYSYNSYSSPVMSTSSYSIPSMSTGIFPLAPPPVHRNSVRRDLRLYDDDDEELSEKKLWDAAGLVLGNWRDVGHTLDMPESDLCSIEHAHRGKVREQAFQMLHKWKEQTPEECTKGKLCQALIELGLNHVASRISRAN